VTRRLLPWLALAVVVVAALATAAGTGRSERSTTARARHVASQLRCPVCEGLSVADSPSPTARAIYDDIHRRVKAGESDEEIRRAFVDRYGESILLRPTSTGIAALVWALPVAVLVLGGAGLGFAFWRWRREPRLAATEADRALVGEALGQRVSKEGA
jgi:cytochrome c-type biogenesis protein CcmH